MSDECRPRRAADKLETRSTKVMNFLTDKDVNFIARSWENPNRRHRFGARLDEVRDHQPKQRAVVANDGADKTDVKH